MEARSGETARDVERFFDSGAGEYDRAYAKPGVGGRMLRERAAAVLELLGLGPGELLDVGMGGGVLLAELDRRGWTVSGVDLAPAMVEAARARLPHRASNLVEGSANALPFSDAAFDTLVATGVLEYALLDDEGVIAELARVLRPEGIAVLSFPNDRAPVNVWRGDVLYPLVRAAKRVLPLGRPAPLDVPRIELSRFRRLLDEAGLVIEEMLPVGARPLPVGLAHRLEQRRGRLAFALAVQVVVRARKVER
ncbi:MAG TPA: class I SAM-dependent methyltransferase [Gaiellaceae bacterium]|nr:class I SAM-dependent methyltransferase [Gaiellaceae bacterium]